MKTVIWELDKEWYKSKINVYAYMSSIREMLITWRPKQLIQQYLPQIISSSIYIHQNK